MQSPAKAPPLRPPPRPRRPPATGTRRVLARYHRLLASLGLQQEKTVGYLKFSGIVQGRKVTISLGARSKNKYITPDISRRVHTGMILSISAETTISTRLLLSPVESRQTWLVRWLQKRQGNSELTQLPAEYRESVVWASEPVWAEGFLARPGVSKLMEPRGCLSGHTLAWGPTVCNLTLARVPQDLSDATLRSYVESLVSVVALAEQHPPRHVASPTWTERQCEQGRMPLIFVGLLFGIIGSLMAVGLLTFGLILAATQIFS